MLIKCTKCFVIKDESEFNKFKHAYRLKYATCFLCKKKYKAYFYDKNKERYKIIRKNNYLENKEKILENNKKYRETNSTVIKERKADYYKTEKGKITHNASAKKWASKNKIKRYAHSVINSLILRKKIKNPSFCSDCLINKNTVAHHDDYSKPLDIRWLCDSCHKLWHKENGEGLNG